MSTKIDAYQSHAGRPVAAPGAAVRAVATQAGATDGKAVASVAASDSLSLTGDALQLQQFEKTLDSIPASDRSRVERLKQAISDGSYQVDSKTVAAKLTRMDYTLGHA